MYFNKHKYFVLKNGIFPNLINIPHSLYYRLQKINIYVT